MSYQLTYQLTVQPLAASAVIITATADNVNAQNSVLVDNLGFYDTLSLVRVVDSIEYPIRGATNVAVTGLSQLAIIDFESPLDVAVFYRAYLDDGTAQAVSNTVTIVTDGQTFWLKDVILGSFSTKVRVESMSDISRPANVLGTYKVLGRQNPVVVTDVRAGRTGTMVLTGFDEGENEDIIAILASGNTLLFQAPGNSQFPDMYFQAGDITEAWRGVSSTPYHSWTIPFTETDPPSEAAFSLDFNSWLLVTQFDTWQDVLNRRATWDAVFVTPFSDNDLL